VAIEHVFSKYDLSVVDRALATELVCGSIRHRQQLDDWIDYLANIPSLKQPPLLRWLLHVGLYQIFYMDRIPISAAVNTTVQIAKENQLGRLAPVANALLRKAVKAHIKGETIPTAKFLDEQLSQKYSIPLWLVKELIRWKGEEAAVKIAEASNKTPAIDLRINCQRSSVQNAQEKLRKGGIESSLIAGCPYGLTIRSGRGDLRNWPGYQEGEWSVQDRSSQWIAPLLSAKPGESILDACAAPGGKTSHLSELVNDEGEIWAVDSSSKRLEKTKINLTRLGLNSVNFLFADASTLSTRKPSWKGYFQKILLDAPCSGLGTLARNPDLRWRITPDKIKELVRLQSKLLEGMLPLLRPGGMIVYSTCTINPDENSKQIENFISNHQCLRLRYQKQLWQGEAHGGDGFYAAIIDLHA